MPRIAELLKKKRIAPSIGLSMLDVICNGLCATFLLFVLVSALQLQKPPIQRVMGMLYIELDFKPDVQSGTEWPGLYLQYKYNDLKSVRNLFDEELNTENRYYETLAPHASILPPQSMVYQDVNNPFKRLIAIHHPVEGIYNPRIYHRDTDNYATKSSGGKLTLQTFFLKAKTPDNTSASTSPSEFKVKPFTERVKFTTQAPSPGFQFLMEEPKLLTE